MEVGTETLHINQDPLRTASPVGEKKNSFFALRAHMSGTARHVWTSQEGVLALEYVQKLRTISV